MLRVESNNDHLMSPDSAGAAEHGEPLARPVLLPAERLAGEQPRAVQLGGAAKLNKVRVTGRGQARPRSPGVTVVRQHTVSVHSLAIR